MGVACSLYGVEKRCNRGKHEGRKPLGRLRRRWEDNIEKDLREIGLNRSGLG
jgi:hypothetical protein